MNRPIALLIALLLASASYAQMPWPALDSLVDRPGHTGHRVAVESWADFNTNGVLNELPLAILRGGFIERDLRERSQRKLRGRNTAGYDMGVRITWTGRDSLFGKAHLRPMASVAHREVLGLRFTDDLYGVAFFGNAPFEDQTVYFNGTSHLNTRYQTMGAGFMDNVTGSYLRVDAVLGQSFNASYIPGAGLYTAPGGTALDVFLQADYWSSDTASSAFGRNNGMGAAISGRLNSAHELGSMPMYVSVEVQDLGLVAWNPRAVRFAKDTAFTFEGFRVENILDLGEVLTGGDQLLDTFGLRFREESFIAVLPFRAMLGVELHPADGWQAQVMVEQRNIPGFVPQITVGAGRRLGLRTLVGANLSHGGFGRLRLGAAVRTRIGERLFASLATTQVPGLVTGRVSGLGAMAAVAYHF